MRPWWLIAGMVAAIIVAGVAVALVFSGGDSASSSPTTTVQGGFPGELSEEQQAQLEAFRSCMSDQGVELPEPGEGPTTFRQPDSEMLGALEECQQHMPEGAVPRPGFGHP